MAAALGARSEDAGSFGVARFSLRDLFSGVRRAEWTEAVALVAAAAPAAPAARAAGTAGRAEVRTNRFMAAATALTLRVRLALPLPADALRSPQQKFGRLVLMFG